MIRGSYANAGMFLFSRATTAIEPKAVHSRDILSGSSRHHWRLAARRKNNILNYRIWYQCSLFTTHVRNNQMCEVLRFKGEIALDLAPEPRGRMSIFSFASCKDTDNVILTFKSAAKRDIEVSWRAS